ncbi:MAG: MgtC/SapB family protein [Patescibacteria group bacterium]
MIQEFFSPAHLEIFGQIALATILGALIGVERELARKTAGMRTFALVSSGAALFSIISQLAFESFLGSSYDPSRIASQVVVGIGFIGAGSILSTNNKVRGLTTAAGLWVSAGIGMAVAYKLYSIAIFATFMTIFILVFLWFIERKMIKRMGSLAAHDSDED